MFENLLPKIFLLVFVPCLIGCFLSKWFVVFVQGYENAMVLASAHALYCSGLFFSRFVMGLIGSGKILFFAELLTVLPYAMGFVTLIHLSGWFFKRWAKKRIFRLHNFFAYLKNRWPQDCLLRLFCFLKNAELVMRMILPLFCIHFLQLLVGSVLMQAFKSRDELGDIT